MFMVQNSTGDKENFWKFSADKNLRYGSPSIWIFSMQVIFNVNTVLTSTLTVAPAHPSITGTRSGAGDYQGLETPGPLLSAQICAQKTTNDQKKPGDGAVQEQVSRKHGGGGQELEARLPLVPAGTRIQVNSGRGEKGFKELWNKDRT